MTVKRYAQADQTISQSITVILQTRCTIFCGAMIKIMNEVKSAIKRMAVYYLLLSINIIPCANIIADPSRFEFAPVSKINATVNGKKANVTKNSSNSTICQTGVMRCTMIIYCSKQQLTATEITQIIKFSITI